MDKIPPHKQTKSAEHHYFPKSLQKLWRDEDGWVSRVSSEGEIKRSKNGTFGHIRNAHHIKIADTPSVWDESFEHFFQQADSSFSFVCGALERLQAPELQPDRDWPQRFVPMSELEKIRPQISNCMASLVVRSPGLRNVIRVGVQAFRDDEVPDHLISVNQKHLLETYAKALAQRGKFVVLVSSGPEFYFGDGFLNNFHMGGPPAPHNPRCVVPILPNVAIAYHCPSSSAVSVDFMMASVGADEVREINSYTMVYSGKHLFYRSNPTEIGPEFQIGQHRQFEYHSPDWLDHLYSRSAHQRF
jgi:hypothetical protein